MKKKKNTEKGPNNSFAFLYPLSYDSNNLRDHELVPITGSICLQASKKGWVKISPCSDFTSLIPSSAGVKTVTSIFVLCCT